jgi:hypothetical protein
MIKIEIGKAIERIEKYPFEVELDKKYRGIIEKRITIKAGNEYEVGKLEYCDKDTNEWFAMDVDSNYNWVAETIENYSNKLGIGEPRKEEN